jgi:SAM-dependent methyltransferase
VFFLELPAERFKDRALVAFMTSLMRQCWINEYVWSTTEQEDAALANSAPDVGRALAGDADEGIRVLLAALYRPATTVLGSLTSVEDLKSLKPNAVRDAIVQQVSERADQLERAAKLARLAPISNETSVKVASQYEEYPFPRWTSLGLLTDSSDYKSQLSRNFGEDRLAFMASPFDVLIAGCGTGLQAVAASFVYGPNARITAIDLSSSSLAYADRMAEKFGASNIDFVQGDILDLGSNPSFAGRFGVIECTGVLHHMADPLAGWCSLKSCLAEEGIMLVALYSDIARKKWTALKNDQEFPGERCDDAALRRFRKSLLARTDAELGPEFKGIRDLYTTSGFRDLILHVSERRFTLPEIGAFMREKGLAFRGFHNADTFEKLNQMFPEETWPGTLEHWTEFETRNPSSFAGMYYFWCDCLPQSRPPPQTG